MASSEVDQKFLARLAKDVADDNPYLSSKLYQVLGLSVMLSKKLVRARRLRKLDTTRDTPSLQLYHHILWLSREGLVIVEQYVIPMVATYTELKVLAHKLRASFYHIFVLFHNNPQATQATIPALSSETAHFAAPSKSRSRKSSSNGKAAVRGGSKSTSPDSPGSSPVMTGGGAVGAAPPPGLRPPKTFPKPTSSFLLPATNYIPVATSCFEAAAALARDLLPGSHPIRLSVRMEQIAFVYDCLRDGELSRRMAKLAIADVYRAQEGMDDDMFEDSSAMVAVLGSMAKRGKEKEKEKPSRDGSRRASPSMHSESAGRTPKKAHVTGIKPSPGMANPI